MLKAPSNYDLPLSNTIPLKTLTLSIASFKTKVFEITKIPVAAYISFNIILIDFSQRLILKGKGLADEKTLDDYTIKSGDTIHMTIKPGFEDIFKQPKVETHEKFWGKIRDLVYEEFEQEEAEKVYKSFQSIYEKH